MNEVYSVSGLFKNEHSEYSLPQDVLDEASDMLRGCLDGIFDIEKNPTFRRTDDEKVCGFCDFRMICGK